MERMPSIKLGDFTLEFELGPPSSEILDVAKKELRESPDLQKQSCAQLQQFLKGTIHQRTIQNNDCEIFMTFYVDIFNIIV